MKTRHHVLTLMLMGMAAIGCGHTGFAPLSEGVPAAFPGSSLPIHASKDIGHPYKVLGYVFRTTEGHKSGLKALDEHMYVLGHDSDEMTELRQEALARGADAIVGFEIFPTLNGWGQPVGFSVGGLAVKVLDEDPPIEPPVVSGEEPHPATPPAESAVDSPPHPADTMVEDSSQPPPLP